MKIVLLLSLLIFSSCSTTQKTCLLNKAAIDIGSGSTKFVIASVDTCKQKIVKELFEKSYSIKFKESIDKNQGSIGNKQVQEANKAFIEIKNLLAKFDIEDVKGVATSAFRKAKNGEKIISGFINQHKLNLKIITQSEEALYGVLAAKQYVDSNTSYLVWDIGGGSMQITLNDNGNITQYFGNLASVPFKKVVLKIKESKKDSPNPIGQRFSVLAEDHAVKYSLKNLPKPLLNLPRQTKVLGIGGVHYYSVKGQTKTKDFYTINDLQKAIGSNILKNDDQIGGDYASTDVSNLILVKGFMTGMKLEKVWPVKINMAHGILVL